ncbi:MAG TPA: DUF799 family lipoprotein [bacterium]|nr:DUF799 family lipoprotein [bacterium]HQO34315.1 DUF799 family lipoprotein [bacterium]HQP98536.1 DUF799 family lipoprotein [bacterium]
MKILIRIHCVLFVALMCIPLSPVYASVSKKVIVAPKVDFSGPVRVALLPMEAKESWEDGSQHTRRAFYGELLEIPEFRLMEPAAVDRLLEQKGLLQENRWSKEDPEILADLLNVDFLIYPRLTAWTQRYFLLQSQTSVAVRAFMVDGHTGDRVWEAESKAKFQKGLTGIPTGGAALALEPLRGMSKRFLYECAFDAAHGLWECLVPQPSEEQQTKKSGGQVNSKSSRQKKQTDAQPESVESALAITSVDAVSEENVLTVTLDGTADCTASFFSGDMNRLFPLTEIASGRYRGQYRIPPGIALSPAQVEVRLVCPDGRAVIGRVEQADNVKSQ